MSTELETTPGPEAAADGSALQGGSYEVIRRRLTDLAGGLASRADALNARRIETFGGTELAVIGSTRVRTENNCVPRDIVSVGDRLLFSYNVYIGLRTETRVSDVFSLQALEDKAQGPELAELSASAVRGLLDDPQFQKDFGELYRYYKDSKLVNARRVDGRLLAVFQTGNNVTDVKAFRWHVSPRGEVQYVDNRGDEDHAWPASHDFEWVETTREQHVRGRHPHINILNEVFVETVGGDLTVKVEDNTEDGVGIYREPVDDPRQALDDAEVFYAKVGGLILLKILPYNETVWRYLVYNTRTQQAVRIDAIGMSCVELPEDHGIIFPGGYYLQTGDMKIFDAEIDDLILNRTVRSPNGEDVLFVFYHQVDGRYLLLPYNLIRKEVQTPIRCQGFTLFDDGRMLVFRSASEEPTRVHPIQIWQTPFVSDEYAASAPTGGTYLEKVGNAELVRGISDAYSLRRLIANPRPTRRTYEELIAGTTRMIDEYHWLGHAEVGDLAAALAEIKRNAELIVDEFEKVLALQRRAAEELESAKESQKDVIRELRPEDWRDVAHFLLAMSALRKQRGRLITLREVRYIDLEAIDVLEKECVDQFDRVSHHCVRFLLTGEALGPLVEQMDQLLADVASSQKAKDVAPLAERLEKLAEGLNLLSEVVSGLTVEDPTQRTEILESISEVFAHLNRTRATLKARHKELLGGESKAEFAAQFKLLGQAVASALAMADSPERCDEQLSRLMVQLEELEGRFSELDEYLVDLAAKREEIYDAFGGKKQQLLDERQRRAQTLGTAADRILDGVARRVRSFASDDDLNAYYASDAMVLKLRQIVGQLRTLGDSVKADDAEGRLKSSKQDALRNLRDKQDLYEDGDNIIKLGKHKFTVNNQPFELTIVPRGEHMALHLSGTQFYEIISDPEFEKTRDYWQQQLVSETQEVYRGEYLAACMLLDAEAGQKGLSIPDLTEHAHDEAALVERVRAYAADRYEEGYERGLHDSDAAKILEKLLALRATAGLLRYAPAPRALGCLFWAYFDDKVRRTRWHRRAMSLSRLTTALGVSRATVELGADLATAVTSFLEEHGIPFVPADARMAGRYLVDELAVEHPRFTTSSEAVRLKDALHTKLDLSGVRSPFDDDLRTLANHVGERMSLAVAWTDAFLDFEGKAERASFRPALLETAVLLVTEGALDRQESAALTRLEVMDLLGQHPRIEGRRMELRLDEFLSRLGEHAHTRVPGYLEMRRARHALLERERHRLRLEELKPRVLTSFVRNQLINDVYLPMIGDNLAKQLGAAGEKKRTDLMGLLLLISPPGYGKTTLMEYMASRLGMVFMKVNGPSLGHGVTSLDPAEAPNATSRQEVEKINLAFEMANNVMLYLDDIQHTNPELLQKFISLCDAQRRIEGVWNGRTQTYDLRGKKFAVVMAGNPYTESGEKFQIPDMLANRADTYNLGDILDGRDQVFALSYIENSLTSNASLSPVAARSLADIHLFIRMARGEEVAQTDFSHTYSRVEVEEISGVLQHLFAVQRVLLRVNQEYIASASQDDRFRTEPPFKLQGSYRNMNKLAEKVASAMNERELDVLVRDHYVGEAQTLTTGAEQNLLKLAELRGVMTPEESARWEQIKKEFRRVQVAGGAGDDPVTRVTSMLGSLGEHLDAIKLELAGAVAAAKDNGEEPWIAAHLARLDDAVKALAQPKLDVHLTTETPKALESVLTKQLGALEQTLLPLVRASSENLDEVRTLARPLLELIELMKLNALSAPPRVPSRAKSAKRAPSSD